MSDVASSNPGNTPPEPPIAIRSQYIKDFSFENPNAPGILAEIKGPPAINVQVDVQTHPMGPNVFEVILVIRAQAMNGDKTLFVVDLTYGGVFALSNVPQNLIGPVLLIEAPRLLFPFARAIVCDATRDGGYPPLFISPIDFAQLYQQKVAQLQAAQAQGPGGSPPPTGPVGHA
ncbi:MAG: protein-export chaperone SecB [Alphaproteobacteria bacterium]